MRVWHIVGAQDVFVELVAALLLSGCERTLDSTEGWKPEARASPICAPACLLTESCIEGGSSFLLRINSVLPQESSSRNLAS